MAGVAKWLRPRFVVPVFGGSSPLVCPIFYLQFLKFESVDRLGGWLFCCLPPRQLTLLPLENLRQKNVIEKLRPCLDFHHKG